MAVLKREEILQKLNATVGDNNSDEVIALIEDVTDTFTDLENKAQGDGKDWKAEAERIDKEWRERYRTRFTKGSNSDDDDDDQNKGGKKEYTFDKLFK